jgi:hypothetical protein
MNIYIRLLAVSALSALTTVQNFTLVSAQTSGAQAPPPVVAEPSKPPVVAPAPTTPPSAAPIAPPVAAPATPPIEVKPEAPAPAVEPPVPNAEVAPTDPSAADTEGDMSVGEIDTVETEELTPEMARKAIDAYMMVQDKYKDSPLADYQDLQEFVDKDPKGKELDADVKGFGFKDVNDWNLAVTTIGVTYNNQLNDQTTEINQQIADVTADTSIAQDMKDRMIKNFKASIPSENNRKIIEDLSKDPTYVDKIKLFETTEE